MCALTTQAEGVGGGEGATDPLPAGLQGQGCLQCSLAESACQEHTVWLQVPRASHTSLGISGFISPSLQSAMCADRHVEKESKEVCPPQESLSSLRGDGAAPLNHR